MSLPVDGSAQLLSRFLLNTEKIIIPDYQRRYSWTKKECRQFIEDIKAVPDSEGHFFGSIVVIMSRHSAVQYNTTEIVDGQQRIITTSLLFCALRDYYIEHAETEVANDIQNKYLDCKRTNMEQVRKLDLNRLDVGAYFKIYYGNIKGKSLRKIYTEYPEIKISKKMIEAYNYFEKLLSEEDPGIILNKLENNLIIVRIESSKESEKFAHKLFETLNDRGLALSKVDLIKNFIIGESTTLTSSEFEEIKNYWGNIITNLDQKGNEISFFRRYLMSNAQYGITGTISEVEIIDKYKDIINEHGLYNVIKDLHKNSIIYKKLWDGVIDMFSSNMNEEINISLKRLNSINYRANYIVLMRAFDELRTRPQDIIKIIKILEVFCIRRSICNEKTALLDEYFSHIAQNSFTDDNHIENIKNYLSSSNRMPKKTKFKNSFKERRYNNNDLTRNILATIEENVQIYNNQISYLENQGTIVRNRYNVHIEHILPQTFTEDSPWENIVNNLTEDEIIKIKKSIGNLTLLEQKLNRKASNKEFIDKKEYLSPSPNSENQNTPTQIKMNHIIYNNNIWTRGKIESRADILSEIALEIWKITELDKQDTSCA